MDSIIREKSLNFALRIVNLCKYLRSKKQEYVLSKQILKSGTSIGANITEALCDSSRKDFNAKMYIAFKETAESLYLDRTFISLRLYIAERVLFT